MSKPSHTLTAVRSPEEIICDCLRELADEMAALGFAEHGLIVKLAAWDFQRLAALQRECGIGLTAEQARDILLSRPANGSRQ